MKLTIASRGSQLALRQAEWVRARLEAAGHECRIEIVKTTGDRLAGAALAELGGASGGKGLFTKEIEEALLDGRADVAVHSMKDLPTSLPEGLAVAAVPEREDARDAMLGRTIAQLETGAVIGASSPRRAAQLRRLRNDLRIEPIRGNVDTRLRKLEDGQYAAIVLAVAGLKRLGWEGRIAQILPVESMCPAVGQGALAVETRAQGAAHEVCAALDCAEAHAAVTAERAVLRALGGGCQVPIGAYGGVLGGELRVSALVIAPDGSECVRGEISGGAVDAEELGARLGADLLTRGRRRAARTYMSKVYLVGAGPGDPSLITVKGRRLLERADAVLYDHLASDALLELAPAHAERVYVGKKKAAHAFSQEEICAMLIERARRGWNVVRLKGGDPFIFGRGGEEAEALADAGIAFEVVPGVSTPLGIAAYTGVPLTHREHTSAVTFVTGHAVGEIDWDRVGMSETLVIFMGLTTFAQIASELIARGRSPATPAMAVRWATRADQQTLAGTLATLPGMIEAGRMRPPATIIVGEVVRLREKLDWFERLPLFSRRIVVTRAREQAGELSAKLRELGAEAVELPAIEIRPAFDPAPLNAAIFRLDTYDWLIFTSVNGVKFFVEQLRQSPFDWRRLRARICAIGPATRAAVESLHLKVDLMGEEYVAEGLLAAFEGRDLAGARVLLPRAAVARDLVPQELGRRGAEVDVVEAYRTVAPAGLAQRAREIFGAGNPPDWVTFTSSSTVHNLLEAVGADALRGVKVASIGPVTTETARAAGLTVTAEAREYTVDGLVAALLGA